MCFNVVMKILKLFVLSSQVNLSHCIIFLLNVITELIEILIFMMFFDQRIKSRFRHVWKLSKTYFVERWFTDAVWMISPLLNKLLWELLTWELNFLHTWYWWFYWLLSDESPWVFKRTWRVAFYLLKFYIFPYRSQRNILEVL